MTWQVETPRLVTPGVRTRAAAEAVYTLEDRKLTPDRTFESGYATSYDRDDGSLNSLAVSV